MNFIHYYNHVIPILLYGNIHNENKIIEYSISLQKLENDIVSLINNGYHFKSLRELPEIINNYSPKNIILIFQGGYMSHYQLVFPIIKKYKIKASMFFSPELFSKKYINGIFSPHYGLNETKKMYDSSYIEFYLFWHPFNYNHDVYNIIGKYFLDYKKDCFKTIHHAILFPFLSSKIIADIKKLKIQYTLIPYDFIDFDRIDNGYQPFVEVYQSTDILDVIKDFSRKFNMFIKREYIKFHSNEYIKIMSEIKLKELDIISSPRLLLNSRHTFPLSVLETNESMKNKIFIIYEYIDIIFRPWYDFFDYDNSFYTAWRNIESFKITDLSLIVNSIDKIRFIKNNIDLGFYCDCHIDNFYIPFKPGFNAVHMTHNILIYGYNLKENVFLVMSFGRKGHYEKYYLSFNDFLQSCSTPYFQCLIFFKEKDAYRIEYDTKIILEKLKIYLNPTKIFFSISKFNQFEKKDIRNYHIANALILHIKEQKEINITLLYSFLEHKLLMAWRMKEICFFENITIPISCQLFISEINKEINHIILLAIKYNINKNENSKLMVCSKIKKISKCEFAAIKNIILILNKKVRNIKKT